MSSPSKSSPSGVKPVNIELPKPVDPTKLPSGAMVSPLSPFFTDRATKCLLEKATGEPAYPLRHAPGNIIEREMLAMAPPRPPSPQESIRSGPLTPLSEAVFPPSMPMIPHSEWSKFGVQLFRPYTGPTHAPMSVNSSNSSSGSNVMRSPGANRRPGPRPYPPVCSNYGGSSSQHANIQPNRREFS